MLSGVPPLPPPAGEGRGEGERPGLTSPPFVRRVSSRLLALFVALALVAAACGPDGPATANPIPAASATALASDTSTATPGPTLDPAASALPSAATTLTPSSTPDPSGTPAATSTGALTDTPTGAPTDAPTGAPTPCVQTQGQFTIVDVPSRVLGYDIITRIYLPPCYDASRAAYPVLYLVHGLNYLEDQWQRLGVGPEADRLIASGEIAPLIIVLPRDQGDDRLDPAFVSDLVPYIDGHYRTLASPGYRAIGGMSRGGGWSIHLGMRYPQLFGRVGAHSPAIFYGDEINVLNYIRAAAKSGRAPALYIDVGDSDPQNRSAVWLDQMLTAYRLAHSYVVKPGGHDEKYWGAHVDDYLRFYAAVWR